MIKDRKSLTMYEAKDIAEDLKETDKIKDLKIFIKKFSELDSKKAGKLKEELSKLDILKLKESDIVKIIEVLPENATDLNKIFTETSLDAEETAKILDAIKKVK